MNNDDSKDSIESDSTESEFNSDDVDSEGAMDDSGEPTTEELQDEGEIHIVGTVHVTHESIDRLTRAIDEHDPEVVAVELGMRRFESLMKQKSGEQSEDPSLVDVLTNSSRLSQGLFSYLASRFQHLQADKMGLQPGEGDMQAAVQHAMDTRRKIGLVDREYEDTVTEYMDRVSKVELVKILGGGALSLLPIFETREMIDRMESGELQLEDFSDEIKAKAPTFYDVFVHKRNIYIADALQKLSNEGYSVVAILGKGHEQAVKDYLDNPEKLEQAKQETGVEADVSIVEFEIELSDFNEERGHKNPDEWEEDDFATGTGSV